jgi:hypothetical protein
MVGAVFSRIEANQTLRPSIIYLVKQEKLDSDGASAKKAKINAVL